MTPIIKAVYRLHLAKGKPIHEQLAAKYMLSDGNFTVLEDHFGLFHGTKEGPVNDEILNKIHSLEHSSYYKVRSVDSPEEHFKSLPVTNPEEFAKIHAKLKDLPTKTQYIYTADGAPQTLVESNKQFYLDQQLIGTEEVAKLIENVRSGKATLETL